MAKSVTRAELLGLLRDWVRTKESGTLSVQTEDRHHMTLVVRQGGITYLAYGSKHGSKGLASLAQFHGGVCHVIDSTLNMHQPDLPTTEAILALLAAPPPPPGEDVSPASGASSGTGSAASPTKFSPVEQQRLLKLVTDALNPYLGPIARMLCEETIKQMGGIKNEAALEVLLHTLSEEIGEHKERLRFLQEARERLTHF